MGTALQQKAAFAREREDNLATLRDHLERARAIAMHEGLTEMAMRLDVEHRRARIIEATNDLPILRDEISRLNIELTGLPTKHPRRRAIRRELHQLQQRHARCEEIIS